MAFPMQEKRLAYIVHSAFSEWMKLPLGEFCLLYAPQSGVQLLIYYREAKHLSVLDSKEVSKATDFNFRTFSITIQGHLWG